MGVFNLKQHILDPDEATDIVALRGTIVSAKFEERTFANDGKDNIVDQFVLEIEPTNYMGKNWIVFVKYMDFKDSMYMQFIQKFTELIGKKLTSLDDLVGLEFDFVRKEFSYTKGYGENQEKIVFGNKIFPSKLVTEIGDKQAGPEEDIISKIKESVVASLDDVIDNELSMSNLYEAFVDEYKKGDVLSAVKELVNDGAVELDDKTRTVKLLDAE